MFSFFFYKQIFISMKNIIVFPYISFNMLYYVSWFLFSYQGGTKYLYIVRPLWRAYAIMIKTTKWIITGIKNLFFFVRVFFYNYTFKIILTTENSVRQSSCSLSAHALVIFIDIFFDKIDNAYSNRLKRWLL